MRSLRVVEDEVSGQLLLGFGDTLICVEIDVLIFDALPYSFDKDVVDPTAFAVHADPDAVGLENVSKFGAGELVALVGVEDLRPAVLADRFFQRLDTEVCAHADRYPVGQHLARGPVDDGDQIDKAPVHRNVGDVGRPAVVGAIDREASEQVRIDRVRRVRRAGLALA